MLKTNVSFAVYLAVIMGILMDVRPSHKLLLAAGWPEMK